MMQQIRKTLKIVCEGTVTEPNYFRGIVNSLKKKKLSYTINISPQPTQEELEDEVEQDNKPTLRKKRKIVDVAVEPIDNLVPEEFKAQPLSYVWDARNSLDENDEVWAVFDHDGHPAIEQAFELAKDQGDGRKVNIAFSSISFEYWILLHFEPSLTTFEKSECRTKEKTKKKKKKVLKHNCGQGIHPLDCLGTKCVTGYIKSQGYIPVDTYIKGIEYKGDIEANANSAILNAIRTRFNIWNRTSPVYELNPYTDVDRLVFKLLHLEFDYKWVTCQELENLEISISLIKDRNNLTIKIKNNKNAAYKYNNEEFVFLDVNNTPTVFSESCIIEPGEIYQVLFPLTAIEQSNLLFLKFPYLNNQNGIVEL